MPSSVVVNPSASQTYQGNTGNVWWCRGPQPTTFSISGYDVIAGVKALLQGAYANEQDLREISLAEDTSFDFASSKIVRHLSLGAARINEFLGQRFQVPLTIWSDTVVWANCELAYVTLSRQRGLNTEALASEFQVREKHVISWLEQARDHEITPDQRLSAQDRPVQALQYFSSPSRGWDREPSEGGHSYYSFGSATRVRR